MKKKKKKKKKKQQKQTSPPARVSRQPHACFGRPLGRARADPSACARCRYGGTPNPYDQRDGGSGYGAPARQQGGYGQGPSYGGAGRGYGQNASIDAGYPGTPFAGPPPRPREVLARAEPSLPPACPGDAAWRAGHSPR